MPGLRERMGEGELGQESLSLLTLPLPPESWDYRYAWLNSSLLILHFTSMEATLEVSLQCGVRALYIPLNVLPENLLLACPLPWFFDHVLWVM